MVGPSAGSFSRHLVDVVRGIKSSPLHFPGYTFSSQWQLFLMQVQSSKICVFKMIFHEVGVRLPFALRLMERIVKFSRAGIC